MAKKPEPFSFADRHIDCRLRTEPIRAVRHLYTRKHGSLFDMHYALELGFVLKGRMRRYHKEGQSDIEHGGIWLCEMWEPHGYEIVKAPCEVLVIMVSPEILAKLHFEEHPAIDWMLPFSLEKQHFSNLPGSVRATLGDCVQRLGKAIDSPPGPTRLCRIRLLLLEILLALYETLPHADAVARATPNSFQKINRAIGLTLGSREFVTTEEAAHACGMGRKAFSKLFRDMMNMRYGEFNLRHRISNVANQLIDTDLPIKTIAAEWGFTDASHMHKCFLKHYGCSPKEYRRQRNSCTVRHASPPPPFQGANG